VSAANPARRSLEAMFFGSGFGRNPKCAGLAVQALTGWAWRAFYREIAGTKQQ
jgi:hypothetical protein